MVELEKHSCKNKHVDLRFHLIKQLKKEAIINLKYCPTKIMITNVFTKPTPKPVFQLHRRKLKLYENGTSEIKEETIEINH